MTGLYRTDAEAADELLQLLFPHLTPDDLRTEGGNVNMPKVRSLLRERAEVEASRLPLAGAGDAAVQQPVALPDLPEWSKRDDLGGLVPSEIRTALRDYARAALAAAPLPARALSDAWQPIETAPRGSGEDGPGDTRHPDYVAPPRLLLATSEGVIVGYYDWYYHPGYGAGAERDESAWRDHDGERTYGVTHWMPLPAAPEAEHGITLALQGEAKGANHG